MFNLIRYTIILLMLPAIYSCKKPGCTGSSGEVLMQQRLVGSFSSIALEDNIDLVLVQNESEKLELTGPKNILANVTTVVNAAGVLSVKNETSCRWLRNADEKITIKVFFKNIQQINYDGSGNITNLDTLHLSSLGILSENGAGDVDLTVVAGSIYLSILKENAGFIIKGKAEFCSAYSNARGLLNLSNLSADKLSLLYSGLADIYVMAEKELEATIRYKGNVYYRGNPVVTKQEYFSSGRLLRAP